jgi:hypothetical protein
MCIPRSSARAQAGHLASQVHAWTDRQVWPLQQPRRIHPGYHTVIEVARGDDRVKANYRPKALTDTARSWLISLPEGTINNWDQLCVVFIRNLQGTYESLSIAETIKTVKQKHDESLRSHLSTPVDVTTLVTHHGSGQCVCRMYYQIVCERLCMVELDDYNIL